MTRRHRPGHPERLLRRLARGYRDIDYANRRALELRTGQSFIDPWERLRRSPRRP